MVEHIIAELRNYEPVQRTIVEIAAHSHADSHAARVVQAQRTIGGYVARKHGGDVGAFLKEYQIHGNGDAHVAHRVVSDRIRLGL